MSDQDKSEPRSYTSFLQDLAKVSSTYKSFTNFFKKTEDVYQSPAKFTLITINTSSNESQGCDVRHFEGPTELEEELEATTYSEESCRLFLVENVCPQTVSLLGEHFNIDPQFFADHFNVESWYRIGESDRLPALPSSQKLQDFLQLRFIETQAILKKPPPSYGIGNGLTMNVSRPVEKGSDVVIVPDDAVSFILPDKTTARVLRKAGRLTPRARFGHYFHPLLLARQAITVWFQKENAGGQGWTGQSKSRFPMSDIRGTDIAEGIVLIDPPFEYSSGDECCEPAERRPFNRRPNWKQGISNIMPCSPIRLALAHHLEERLNREPSLLEAAQSNCFLIIGDIYRIVASNWVVIDQYINRELATVEYILEKEEPDIRQLEIYLKEMYMHRRRCSKYCELIEEAKQQCHDRGQSSWPRTSDSTSSAVGKLAQDLEQDFVYLLAKTHGTALRTQKTIQLLTALVSIAGGKQAINENHSIGRLSLLAMVFLPFSTVGTILGIQTIYGPGQSTFWLFWTISIPLTVFILTMASLYDKIGESLYRPLGRLGVQVRDMAMKWRDFD
jgi:hypothetical protein